MNLDAKIPTGPMAQKWDKHRFDLKLVNPANKRKYEVIVVGSGLAGASAAASMAELGYNVKCFCYQDSPRRAHSIAAQGGINAAKNYQNDDDSVWRLFYDTVKGGDFRSREYNYRTLLEAAAMARPIITTDVTGCREVVDDGVNGYLCNLKDAEDLAIKMEKFLHLSEYERAEMGRNGRRKVEQEFDEKIMINLYLETITNILNERSV